MATSKFLCGLRQNRVAGVAVALAGSVAAATGFAQYSTSSCQLNSGEDQSSTIVRRHKMTRALLVSGTVVHSLGLDQLEVIENCTIGVGPDGRIAFVKDSQSHDEIQQLCHKHKLEDPEIITLDAATGQFCMPGMVDTHVHASQYPYAGTGYDKPLMQWLETYTFPTEARYRDLRFTEDMYRKAVKRFVRNGTTTACYFATIFKSSTIVLADIVEEVGQRAYIGKVCMDQFAPDDYREETKASIADTEELVVELLARESDRIKPVVTPRFVPTCTSDLLSSLGKIAKDYNVPVQSHLSENKEEINIVAEQHPDCCSYTDVYDKHGLLTDKTVMAHCIYLSDEEVNTLNERKTGVAHCPNSNFSIMSGVLDIRRLLDVGIKVGLGTDVAGGYSPSILDAARQAITASKLTYAKFDNCDSKKPLSYQEAFFLATLGGSQVLALDDQIGNFQPGKYFDALVVDLSAPGSPIDLYDRDSFQDKLSKFIFLGDDRNIRRVYVAGDQIVSEA